MRAWKTLALAMLPALACATAVRADLVRGDLARDPTAQAGWHGTRHFAGNFGYFSGDIEYAVYAPGNFTRSTVLGNPADPSGGTRWVYAYQLWNDAASKAVIKFSMGMADNVDGDEAVEKPELPQDIGTLASSGGTAPALTPQIVYSGNKPQYGKWDYALNNIAVGGHSRVLYYTSPYGPEWDTGSVTVVGDSVPAGNLPSPTPEPGTWLMLLLAAVALGLCRWMAQVRRMGRHASHDFPEPIYHS